MPKWVFLEVAVYYSVSIPRMLSNNFFLNAKNVIIDPISTLF